MVDGAGVIKDTAGNVVDGLKDAKDGDIISRDQEQDLVDESSPMEGVSETSTTAVGRLVAPSGAISPATTIPSQAHESVERSKTPLFFEDPTEDPLQPGKLTTDHILPANRNTPSRTPSPPVLNVPVAKGGGRIQVGAPVISREGSGQSGDGKRKVSRAICRMFRPLSDF